MGERANNAEICVVVVRTPEGERVLRFGLFVGRGRRPAEEPDDGLPSTYHGASPLFDERQRRTIAIAAASSADPAAWIRRLEQQGGTLAEVAAWLWDQPELLQRGLKQQCYDLAFVLGHRLSDL